MSTVITFRGDKVGLGPLREGLIDLYTRWSNDPEIMLPLSGHVYPFTEKDAKDWYEKYGQRGDGSTVHFLVYELAYPLDLSFSTERPIGIVALSGINYRGRTAWASSYIGERDAQGKGFGTEARRLLLDYAFGPCGLNNVTVAIHADNPASLRVAEKLGYRVIGRQREACRRGSEFVDAILLDITASDWKAPK